MPRKRKLNVADPLDFDHTADVRFALDSCDLPGADVLMTSADLARRWRTSPDAIRKQRERATGPPFICLNRRRIVYRLIDIINFEANRLAFSRGQARAIGLL